MIQGVIFLLIGSKTCGWAATAASIGFGQRGAAQKELAKLLHLSRCERSLVDVVKQPKLHPKLLRTEREEMS